MQEQKLCGLRRKGKRQKQIEAMQEEISTKAWELWNDALNNIDNLVYPHKWDYLDYLEGLRCRKTSTLTLQQVKERILSFEEFNKMKECESGRSVARENPATKPAMDENVVVEQVMEERAVTIEGRAKEIAIFIRDNYGRYDNVPEKVKADLFQFSGDDLNVDMKLHSLVLKELNVKMYSSELYDDYIKVVDVTEKKQSDETRNNDYYSDEK